MRQRATKHYQNIISAGLIIPLMWFLTGCGGSHATAIDARPGAAGAPLALPSVQAPGSLPAGAGFALPAPSTLTGKLAKPAPAVRHVSFAEADVRKDGNAFGALLPQNHAIADGANATFTPNWINNKVSAPADLAYCTYAFTVPGYNRNAQVRLAWGIPPADFRNTWIGLAHWSADRWEWYRDTATGQINVPSLAPYFDIGGNLLVVVVRIGTDLSSLSEVRLGGLPPIAAFSATPRRGKIPLTVNFDATASDAAEGTIVKHEWDYDGNGVYDEDTGAVAMAMNNYILNGGWQATLRVTNTLGITATASVLIQVGPWLHTLGRNADDAFYSVAAATTGEIYAVGFTHETRVSGDADLLLLTKWSPEGALVWAKAWDSGFPGAYGYDLAVDSAGNIDVVGKIAVGDFDTQGLYQQWTPDGALTWSYQFGDAEWESLNTLAVDGTELYCAGTKMDSGATDVMAVSVFGDGTIDWASEYYAPSPDYPVDSALRWNFSSGNNAYYVLAQHDASNSPMLLHYTLGMSLVEGKIYGDGLNNYYAKSLLVSQNAVDLTTTLYVAGQASHAGGDAVFLSCADGAYNIQHQSVSYRVAATVGGMIFGNSGDILICGSEPGIDAGSNYGFVWRFGADSGSLFSADLYDNGGTSSHIASPVWTPDGMLVAGDAASAGGSWTTINPSTFTPTASWSDGPGTSALVTLAPSYIGGEIKDWSAPVLDTGGGTADALLALRELP